MREPNPMDTRDYQLICFGDCNDPPRAETVINLIRTWRSPNEKVVLSDDTLEQHRRLTYTTHVMRDRITAVCVVCGVTRQYGNPIDFKRPVGFHEATA